MSNSPTLGELVRQERRRRRLSRRAVATRAGADVLDATEVSAIESRSWLSPPPDALHAVATGLEPDDAAQRAELYVRLLLAAGHLSADDVAAAKRVAA
jgi:transcriptional regulator with XRE-family HTH domain